MKQNRTKPNMTGVHGILITAGLCLSLYHGANFYRWVNEPYELISPLGIVQVQASEPKQTPAPTPKPIDFDKVITAIGELESNNGRNQAGLAGICKRQGESNNYGYGGMKLKICFADDATARARVKKWLTDYYPQKGNDLAKTLCYYNLGGKESTCKYYTDYLVISGK